MKQIKSKINFCLFDQFRIFEKLCFSRWFVALANVVRDIRLQTRRPNLQSTPQTILAPALAVPRTAPHSAPRARSFAEIRAKFLAQILTTPLTTALTTGLTTILMTVLTFLTLTMSSAARAESEPVELPEFWDMVTDLPRDLKVFGQQSLSSDGLTIAAGVTAMTAITVATDFESWQAAQVQVAQRQSVRKFANAGVSIGDGFFQFGIVGVFAGAGMITENTRALRTASQITESILATGIVVQIIKHITGRESPFSSESRTGVWRVFPNQAEYMKDFQKFDAVPSGHLSTTVTTLIAIQENYPEQKWIPFVGWPVVGWVAFGLAGTSIHWWSDYPIAIALGYSIAKIVTADNKSSGTHASRADLNGKGKSPNGGTAGLSQSQRRDERSSHKFVPTLFPTVSTTGEPIIMAGWTF